MDVRDDQAEWRDRWWRDRQRQQKVAACAGGDVRPGRPVSVLTAGDLAHARTRAHRVRVDRALGAIEAAAEIGRIGLSYSGGKDSTCALDLVRRVVPDAPAAFFDSGCEYPWTYEIVRHYGATIMALERDSLDMYRYVGMWEYDGPAVVDREARFDRFGFLVGKPAYRFIHGEGLAVVALGLRGAESAGRRMNARAHGMLYPTKDEHHHLCPLAFWTADDDWAYVASRGLRYNEAYDRMAAIGVPRAEMRVSTLLGVTAATWGGYAILRRIWPEGWQRLSAEFPGLRRYT